MDVSEVLKRAWVAVQSADLPAGLHLVAFQEAVRLSLPTSAGAAGATRRADSAGASLDGSSGPAHTPSSGREREISVSEDEIYDRVAAQTAVTRDKLERVVHLDDDGLRVSLPGLKLGKNNAERARAVAQILTITRGFGLEENETSLEVIRTECDRLRVYDSANFSSHMKALNGYVLTGAGSNRRLRAKGPGIQAFPSLVDGLLEAVAQ
jgi:hypothetical protein